MDEFKEMLGEGHGVLHIESHGGLSVIPVMTFKTEAACAAQYNAYIAPNGGYTAYQIGYRKHTTPFGGEIWCIYVKSPAITQWYKSSKSIVTLTACNSAPLLAGAFEGARDALGFEHIVDVVSYANPAVTLFYQCLDGTKPDDAKGTRRATGDAQALVSATYSWFRFDDDSQKNSTLAPIVQDYHPKSATCDGCEGFVEFDTTVDTSVDESSVVYAMGESGCGVYLYDHVWESDTLLTFRVASAIVGGVVEFCVTTEAKSANNGSPLDGNQDPTVGTNGEGPGWDEFIWTVDLTVGACDPSFVQADRRGIRLLTLLREIKEAKRSRQSD